MLFSSTKARRQHCLALIHDVEDALLQLWHIKIMFTDLRLLQP